MWIPNLQCVVWGVYGHPPFPEIFGNQDVIWCTLATLKTNFTPINCVHSLLLFVGLLLFFLFFRGWGVEWRGKKTCLLLKNVCGCQCGLAYRQVCAWVKWLSISWLWTREMTENKLPSLRVLLFLTSSKGTFICTIPQRAQHIPQGLCVASC